MPRLVAAPEHVQVGPQSYTVKISHEAMTDYSKATGDDAYGCTQHRTSTMIIDDIYQPEIIRRCLLHEVLHAVHHVYDLEEVKAGDEHYVRVFSAALLDLMQRNPTLVSYLTGGGDGCVQFEPSEPCSP